MKTKFTKVEVSERLPEKHGKYLVIDITGEIHKVPFLDDEFYSWQPVKFWLEESPDLEDEMREMLERIQDLDVLPIEIEDELSNLLQSLKQEK